MFFSTPRPKGGNSRARALRAKKGHARRRANLLSSTHYKGSKKARVRSSWLGF